MSQTFSLICRRTGKSLWVGQGWGSMDVLYAEQAYVKALREFLNAHRGEMLELVCNDDEDAVSSAQPIDANANAP